MQRRSHLSGVAVLAALLVGVPAGAQSTSFFAQLTTGQEPYVVTPVYTDGTPRPMPFGWAHFTLNADRTALSWTAVIHNLDITGTQTADTNDDLRAAHIHAIAPGGAPPATGGVVWGFFGAPFNDTDPNDAVVTPFTGGAVGGEFRGVWNAGEGNNTTLAEQLAALEDGRLYMNFHTNQYPGGELRGALLVTPEPATVLLLGSGLLALGVIGRRRSTRG